MWSTTSGGNVFNINGDRTLGEYTEIQRELQMVYDLAQKLGVQPGDIFAQIDPGNDRYELATGDSAAALAYGLKPYIVAPQYAPKSLVPLPMSQQVAPNLSSSMQPQMLRTLLTRIVEDA